MRGFAIATIALATLAAPGGGRAQAPSTPFQLYTACFRQAIEAGQIAEAKQSIVFTCRHAPAEAFFNALGDYGVKTVSEGNRRQGVFRTRYMKPPKGDRCYEQTAAVGGAPMSAYSCQLFFPAGLILKM